MTNEAAPHRPRLSTSVKILIGAATALAVGIGAAALLLGWLSFGGSSTAYPPCEELPTVTQATDALASHGGLADEIAALGDGIHLQVATPCTDDATAALIEISYATDAERDAIKTLLGQRNGFGVPLNLVKR